MHLTGMRMSLNIFNMEMMRNYAEIVVFLAGHWSRHQRAHLSSPHAVFNHPVTLNQIHFCHAIVITFFF